MTTDSPRYYVLPGNPLAFRDTETGRIYRTTSREDSAALAEILNRYHLMETTTNGTA